MKKETVLKNLEEEIKKHQKSIKLVNEIKLYKPIMIKYHNDYYVKDAYYNVVVIPVFINKFSFKMEMVASPKKEYPWPKPDHPSNISEKFNMVAIPFNRIFSWKELNKEDYADLLTYEVQYPSLVKVLKNCLKGN